MNVDVPSLAKAAVPEAEGRNARIVSQNSNTNYRDPNFLSSSFPRGPPKLYITAEDKDFDPVVLAEWKAEGFELEYIPMGRGGDAYKRKLQALSQRKMGPCETFGIVAFGEAAALCLEHYHVLDNNPEFKLCLLIAYYPTSIPDPQGQFPSSISALVHLPGGEDVGVTKQTQMVGIQGKRRTTSQRVDYGAGTGGKLALAYPAYAYDAESGFAEHDLDEYDQIAAGLAWSRSLAAARKAFGQVVDLEAALDENVQGKFFARNLDQTMGTFTTTKSPHVTHIPTLTGGIGAAELTRFYGTFFRNPQNMGMTLLSRTIGADRVVDELHVKFKHTQEMPWILPGVPPTGKRVEIALVSIVALRGGKLHHEHVYWDQASVLVQVGLLNPNAVPAAAKDLGVERLPVVGKRVAKRLLEGWDEEEEGEADNALISDWEEDEDDGEDDEEEDGEEEEEEDEEEEGEEDKTEGSDGETTKDKMPRGRRRVKAEEEDEKSSQEKAGATSQADEEGQGSAAETKPRTALPDRSRPREVNS